MVGTVPDGEAQLQYELSRIVPYASIAAALSPPPSWMLAGLVGVVASVLLDRVREHAAGLAIAALTVAPLLAFAVRLVW